VVSDTRSDSRQDHPKLEFDQMVVVASEIANGNTQTAVVVSGITASANRTAEAQNWIQSITGKTPSMQSEQSFVSGETVYSHVVLVDLDNVETALVKAQKSLQSRGSVFVANPSQSLESALKLAGFINVKQSAIGIEASKPAYEVGTSAKLKLGKRQDKQAVQAAWAAAAANDDNEMLEDANALLDEEDKLKAQTTLEDCDVPATGTRKACKNCSCGRAEEEIAEAMEETKLSEDVGVVKNKLPKSSCGNVRASLFAGLSGWSQVESAANRLSAL